MEVSHGMNFFKWKVRYENADRKKYMTERYYEKRLLVGSLLLLPWLLELLFSVYLFTPSWASTEDGSSKCVRKEGGQETFEWLCTDGKVIYLAKSDNIKNCYTCFLKKFSDWTWEQEKRKGIREDPKHVTCRRYKRVQAKNGQQVCLYRGANNTYTLVVEGQCPVEFQCRYDPNGKEPNIDSVVDSLNDSFK